MKYIKIPNLDFWDEQESFTIEELTYLFYNLEPQYDLPPPKQIMATMKLIINDDGIFGIEQKKGMHYVPDERRFLIRQEKKEKTEDGKQTQETTYSEDVTLFPRQALRQWAIEQQVLDLYDFLKTKEERAVTAAPPGDTEPAHQKLPSVPADISAQSVAIIPEPDIHSVSLSPKAGDETSPDDD